MEGIRLDEGPTRKVGGRNCLAGSSPVPSVLDSKSDKRADTVLKTAVGEEPIQGSSPWASAK